MKLINLGALSTMCCSFVNISYFGLKFLQYTPHITQNIAERCQKYFSYFIAIEI